MTLQDYYAAMRTKAVRHLLRGDAELDIQLDSGHDTRRGVTLLTRPPASIIAALEALMDDFRRLEPEQYYYPATDIHLTILAVISCYPGFTLAQINPANYRAAVRQILQTSRPFTITYSGLTASPGGIIAQGFPEDAGLQQMRDNTRQFFRHSALPQSIDQRYSIQTAHSTLIRFRRPLRNPAGVVELLGHYQHQFIGSFAVNTVELVYNDWYQRAAHTVLLEKYALGHNRQPAD
ncbi:2'-5' RNA ligase family protein [Hymenobacter lucidus]|uniref:Mutarotase n=1 Tax=Hymenobacter lucidus TaxID=2880930 RepID=A0ABS8AUQ9_9BACT|nr:mutarotase [Hymenobacter lucidus]MCB2409799.1 mutarotase [Hymenobacter lucidus]